MTTELFPRIMSDENCIGRAPVHRQEMVISALLGMADNYTNKTTN